MSEWATFEPGRQVWTRRRHGGWFGRAVPERMWGEVFGTRRDGRVVVAWDNGRTTAAHPSWLSTGADVDPGTDGIARAALSDLAAQADFVAPVDPAARETWDRAWTTAVDGMRAAMVWHGLICDPTEIYDGRTAASTAGDVTSLDWAARFSELYDADPQYVDVPGARFKAVGLANAEALAHGFRRDGIQAAITPADDTPALGAPAGDPEAPR
ncbi:MAG: hypothetical protein ACJ786_30605 [Catenulispora sp.]